MSYDIASGANSQLSRTSGSLGSISMGWVKYLEYIQGNDDWFYAQGNGDDWGSGTGGGAFGVSTSIYGFTQNNNNGVIESSSNTSWVFICIVETSGVGITCYYRHETDTSLTSFSVVDTGVINAASILLGTAFLTSNHKRITAYKEWTSTTSLTAVQIFAESTQNAPIVTTGLTNYLQCDSGHTVGTDQSAAAQNWTVSGTTITTNADEPNMAVSVPFIRQYNYVDSASPSTFYTSQSITLAGVLAGNTLLMFSTGRHAGSGTMSVSDSTNGAWPATIDQIHDGTDGDDDYTFLSIISNVLATTGTLTVTATPNTTSQHFGTSIFEVANVSTSPIDGHSSFLSPDPVSTSTDAITTGTFSNTFQPGILIAASNNSDLPNAGPSQAAPNAGTGFTDLGFAWFYNGVENLGGCRFEYKLLSTVGSQSAIFTAINGGATHVSLGVALMALGTGSTGAFLSTSFINYT